MASETVWNVSDGKAPSAITLIWSDHREQYDWSRKSSAVAYARELLADGYANVRVFRSSQARRYNNGGMRTFAVEVINQEVSL